MPQSRPRRDPGLRSRHKACVDAPGGSWRRPNALRSSIDPTAKMPTIPQASFALAAGEGLAGTTCGYMTSVSRGARGVNSALLGRPNSSGADSYTWPAATFVDLLHTDRPVGILLTGKGTYVALGASFSLSDGGTRPSRSTWWFPHQLFAFAVKRSICSKEGWLS